MLEKVLHMFSYYESVNEFLSCKINVYLLRDLATVHYNADPGVTHLLTMCDKCKGNLIFIK